MYELCTNLVTYKDNSVKIHLQCDGSCLTTIIPSHCRQASFYVRQSIHITLYLQRFLLYPLSYTLASQLTGKQTSYGMQLIWNTIDPKYYCLDTDGQLVDIKPDGHAVFYKQPSIYVCWHTAIHMYVCNCIVMHTCIAICHIYLQSTKEQQLYQVLHYVSLVYK